MNPDCPKELANLDVVHVQSLHTRAYVALNAQSGAGTARRGAGTAGNRNREPSSGVILRRSSSIVPTLQPDPDDHPQRTARSHVPYRDVRSGGQRRHLVSDCGRVRGSRLADRSEDW